MGYDSSDDAKWPWLQDIITMKEGKLMIIPPLGHQNKETSTSEAWLAFVFMSQCRNNNELALQQGRFCTMWSLVAKGLLHYNNYYTVFWQSKSSVNWVFSCYCSCWLWSILETLMTWGQRKCILGGCVVGQNKHQFKWFCSGLTLGFLYLQGLIAITI